MSKVVKVYDGITDSNRVVAVKALFLIDDDVVGEHLFNPLLLCLVVGSEIELLCWILL